MIESLCFQHAGSVDVTKWGWVLREMLSKNYKKGSKDREASHVKFFSSSDSVGPHPPPIITGHHYITSYAQNLVHNGLYQILAAVVAFSVFSASALPTSDVESFIEFVAPRFCGGSQWVFSMPFSVKAVLDQHTTLAKGSNFACGILVEEEIQRSWQVRIPVPPTTSDTVCRGTLNKAFSIS